MWQSEGKEVQTALSCQSLWTCLRLYVMNTKSYVKRKPAGANQVHLKVRSAAGVNSLWIRPIVFRERWGILAPGSLLIMQPERAFEDEWPF